MPASRQQPSAQRTFTADELDQIPPCAKVTVATTDGERVTGIFDGAFSVRDKITGCQVLDNPPFGVRFIKVDQIDQITLAP